jgi:hypothetical protein
VPRKLAKPIAVAALAAVALVLLVAPGSTSAADTKPVLFSKQCSSGHYKPQEIIIACADARASFEATEWTRWDSTGARAEGIFLHADCSPRVPLVACKHNARDHATVKLYRVRFCPKQGRRFFTRLRLTDPETSNKYLRQVKLSYPCGYVE